VKVRAAALALALVAAGAIVSEAPAPPSFAAVREAYRPSDAWLLDRHGDALAQLRLDHGGRRLPWTPLNQTAPALVAVLKQAEDQRFDAHGGVDVLALAGSLRDYAVHGVKRGGSTLSMQLAARLDPELASRKGRRSVLEKVRQMRGAWALERQWQKDEILEAYLNLVSFRGELQGVYAATATLFGKQPSQLDVHESALLAALLRDPEAPAPVVAARACRLAAIADCGAFTRLAPEAFARDRVAAMDAALAPHLARALLREPGQRVTSTADRTVQRIAQAALRNQLSALLADEARDGAAVVLDNATGDVLAYVGSAGPLTTAPNVDGAGALRQAGSTLKPFLYALAFERRLLTPASLLDDSEVNLDTGAGLYIPQNYDHEFRGPVSVRQALAGSLNVPAVRTLLLVGLEPFRERLHELGYEDGLTEAGEFYGYSLALGAPEVSLVEQANAYRTLANGGRWSPVRRRLDDPRVEPRAVVDPAAAFLVADILADNAARAASFGFGSPLVTPFWSAAKTGTSKDMRDNWCIGFTTRHTVAVWVGNFEGDSMRNVSGVTGAAPAWLEIVTAISALDPPAAPAVPDGLVRKNVTFHGIEQARQAEWFIQGTEQSHIRASHGRPRIASPADGMIAALDPDIPADQQHILLEAGNATGAQWELDGVVIGRANRRLLPPSPGQHSLRLLSAQGRELDAVAFTVRGVPAPMRTARR
jgi:penicillin-binding protein 1C